MYFKKPRRFAGQADSGALAKQRKKKCHTGDEVVTCLPLAGSHLIERHLIKLACRHTRLKLTNARGAETRATVTIEALDTGNIEDTAAISFVYSA